MHWCSQDQYGLVSHFFGADGSKLLSLDTFRSFVTELRSELLRLEFEHYDWQGKVGGRGLCGWVGECMCCASTQASRNLSWGSAGAAAAVGTRGCALRRVAAPPHHACTTHLHLQGSIGGHDFACSVVSCARLKHVDQYLDKVQVGVLYMSRRDDVQAGCQAALLCSKQSVGKLKYGKAIHGGSCFGCHDYATGQQ